MLGFDISRVAAFAALSWRFGCGTDLQVWTVQRYKDRDCANAHSATGAQQTWKKVVGFQHCFEITSELRLGDHCRSVCSIQIFCARNSESESGVKMRYFPPGQACSGTSDVVIDFMPLLTWPETQGLFEGNCTLREPNIYERFSTPINVGEDVPNCYGYDHSTKGTGVFTADPKDSPYTLKIYTDAECSVQYDGGIQTGNASSFPTWNRQVWMNVLRKFDTDKRTADHKHCWEIVEGAPQMTFFGSLKLVCQVLTDSRMGLMVEHYENGECTGSPRETEIFYMKARYTALSASQGDVEELKDLFQGKCTSFEGSGGTSLYWKWDREVWHEDWPDCYAEAIRENVRVRRPSISSVLYSGDVNVVRKIDTTTSSSPPLGIPRLAALFAVIAWYVSFYDASV
mmetsp:Transcript_59287/g.165520  ORF Transcript_59287/g.165520 Transcript_59287/m.165520 type:complete len:399 (-) Transcript_59287:130-1326(-)